MAHKKDNGLIREMQKVLLDDSDFLKKLIQENLQKILEAEFESKIQAKPYERTDDRQGYRNGTYTRTLKTRVGTLELQVIRDREGKFSTELFDRYQRSEKALVLSLIEMYINGVSTRKVKKITEKLCGTMISKSTVSVLTKELDKDISRWRNRALTEEYPYLMVDARYESVRKHGVIVSQAVLIVIGISSKGYREILSVDVGDSEDEQTWTNIFRRLKVRGLKGVTYVVSDDHSGLVKSIKREFQGAVWQRCQVHFIRNFMSKFSKKERPDYLRKLKDVFNAPDMKEAIERKDKLVIELESYKKEISEWLDNEIESCFSVYSLPFEHQKRMRSTNMIERLNQELLKRSRIIRIFPNVDSIIRLFGSMCIEQSEKWQTGYRYLDMTLPRPKKNQRKQSMFKKTG